MRKEIALFSAVLASMTLAMAQNIDDAMNFAENDYYGTARTMGMGNAVTAIGSDLGSITINPAGSAVARYSQISISPGVSISGTRSFVDNLEGSSDRIGKARFILPHIGAVMRFSTGRDSGVKAITIGFSTHMTNNFNNSWSCGAKTNTSYAGRLAYCASTAFVDKEGNIYGYTPNQLKGDWNDDVDWTCMLGYRTGMIGVDQNASPDFWTGVTEDYKEISKGGVAYDANLSHPVNTTYTRQTWGSKLDYVVNFGLNISDVVFIGANLGLQTYRYGSQDYLTERKVNGELYSSRFSRLSNDYTYNCSGNGIYGKFGIIAAPVDGLRIGAAFTTPTVMNLAENWQTSMSVSTSADSSGDVSTSQSGATPLSENRYSFVSPLRFNLGLAYTIGRFAIISADYEMVNYSRAEFRRASGWANDFSEVNSILRGSSLTYNEYESLGFQHMLRAGLEVKPLPFLAVRAGYNLSTSGRVKIYDGRRDNIKANTHAFTFGFGFDSSASPFFADIACRIRRSPETYTQMYGDYQDECDSPWATSRQTLTTIVATIGWRF